MTLIVKTHIEKCIKRKQPLKLKLFQAKKSEDPNPV